MKRLIKKVLEVFRKESSLCDVLFYTSYSFIESLRFTKLKRISIKPINMTNLSSYHSNAQKEMKNPLVRVRIITYNNVKVARQNLDGVLMQKTDFPFEIYVFDDCSTDGTSDIVREYAQKYPNIIADIQPENLHSKGTGAWTKKVIQARKDHSCKYVAILDGDDYWIDPYKLQYQVEFLEDHSDFSMCSGGFLYNNDFSGGQLLEQASLMRNLIGIEYASIPKNPNILLTKSFTTVYRTDATPGYDVMGKYKFCWDVHLWYYTLLKGKGCYLTRIFGVSNVSESGIFNNLSNERRVAALHEVYGELYRETREELFRKWYLRQSKLLELYRRNPDKATANTIFH